MHSMEYSPHNYRVRREEGGGGRYGSGGCQKWLTMLGTVCLSGGRRLQQRGGRVQRNATQCTRTLARDPRFRQTQRPEECMECMYCLRETLGNSRTSSLHRWSNIQVHFFPDDSAIVGQLRYLSYWVLFGFGFSPSGKRTDEAEHR